MPAGHRARRWGIPLRSHPPGLGGGAIASAGGCGGGFVWAPPGRLSRRVCQPAGAAGAGLGSGGACRGGPRKSPSGARSARACRRRDSVARIDPAWPRGSAVLDPLAACAPGEPPLRRGPGPCCGRAWPCKRARSQPRHDRHARPLARGGGVLAGGGVFSLLKKNRCISNRKTITPIRIFLHGESPWIGRCAAACGLQGLPGFVLAGLPFLGRSFFRPCLPWRRPLGASAPWFKAREPMKLLRPRVGAVWGIVRLGWVCWARGLR